MAYAFVTGGSRGIGREIAFGCGELGYDTIVVARNENDLSQLRNDWRERGLSTELICVAADLSSGKVIGKLIGRLGDDGILPEVIVNNAGRFSPGALTEDPDLLSSLLDLNLLAPHRLTAAWLPEMLARGSGTLITVGSTAATGLGADMAAYAISKAALHAWHRCLEGSIAGSDLRSLLLVPGPVLTSSWKDQSDRPERMLTAEGVARRVTDFLRQAQAGERGTITVRP